MCGCVWCAWCSVDRVVCAGVPVCVVWRRVMMGRSRAGDSGQGPDKVVAEAVLETRGTSIVEDGMLTVQEMGKVMQEHFPDGVLPREADMNDDQYVLTVTRRPRTVLPQH